MNSSAKSTAVSFLAAAALGAAIFTGCTVTSGTVDDVDGGSSNQNNTDSGTQDASTEDVNTAPVCESKQSGTLVNEECQACLDANCCTELKTCFDIPADENAGTVDCNDYATCIHDVRDECNAKPTQQEIDDCFADCDLTAATGVQAAYEAIEECAVTSCSSVCSGE